MKTQGKYLGIPYDWRWPSWKITKSRFWNKEDHRVFTPHVLGWGYSLNFYELTHNRKKWMLALLTIFAGLILLIGSSAVKQIKYLDKAHSTFENYYAFRGCTNLLERKDNYGICKTSSGETIKIVKYKDKWYLAGDLPCGFLCF